MEKYNAKLLIFDLMSSYIGGDCSMNNANETRAEFNHLIAVARTPAALSLSSPIEHHRPYELDVPCDDVVDAKVFVIDDLMHSKNTGYLDGIQYFSWRG